MTSPVVCTTSTVQIEAATAAEDEFISIELAQEKPIGTHVVIQGRVSALPGTISPYYFYVEEDGYGIQVYNYRKQFGTFALGSVVKVYGEISSAYGMPRVKIKTAADISVITLTGKNSDPVVQSDIVAESGGALVAVEGEVVEKDARHIVLSTATSEVFVRLPKEKIKELKVGILHRDRAGRSAYAGRRFCGGEGKIRRLSHKRSGKECHIAR
jgi:hypothetical protein